MKNRYRSSNYSEGEKLPRTSQLSISITPDQKTRLNEYALNKKVSISKVIRELLKENGIIGTNSNKAD